MTGRRQFLTTLGVSGLSLLFAKNVSGSMQSADTETKDYFSHLLKTLDMQSRLQGFDLLPEEKESLAYACDNIKPKTHAELAFVVAIGSNGNTERNKQLVDEYVRRRNGIPPRLNDHPLLELTQWGTPHSYRIMIYREQLIALIQEVTGSGRKNSTAFYARYIRRKDIMPLQEIATKEYQERLTKDEFQTLEEVMRYYAGFALPYYFCSTIADRAESLAKTGYQADNLRTRGL